MNTITRSIVTAAMIGAAALGLAGTAAATTSTTTSGSQSPAGPGYRYSPGTHASPAPTVGPGRFGNHGPAYIAHLQGR